MLVLLHVYLLQGFIVKVQSPVSFDRTNVGNSATATWPYKHDKCFKHDNCISQNI